MTMIDNNTADLLETLLSEHRDRNYGGAPDAPTITRTVTFTRDRYMMGEGDIEVWTVSASYGSDRGLLWIETPDGPKVIESATLGQVYPEFERRQQDVACVKDRRAA